MIPKRSFILPAISALAVGGVLWAAHGTVPLATNTHHSVKPLNVKLAADPVTVGDPSNGGCTASAGNKGLLSKPMPVTDPKANDPSVTASQNYSITFNDGSGLLCAVWQVDGSTTTSGVSQSGGPKTYTLSIANVDPSKTVMLFVVDKETGGKWDSYAWGPNTNSAAAANGMTFTSNCGSTAGQKNMLFNPSGYGAQFSATYSDATKLQCFVWFVDGVAQPQSAGGQGTGTSNHQTLTFQLPNNQPSDYYDQPHTIMLAVVNSEAKSHWDTYTWTKPTCGYPPGTKLSGHVSNKGEIIGNLAPSGDPNCSDGKGHKITATFSKGGPQTVTTDPMGNFKFGGHPPDAFPASVSFAGDATEPGAATIGCSGYGADCG